MAGDTEAYAV